MSLVGIDETSGHKPFPMAPISEPIVKELTALHRGLYSQGLFTQSFTSDKDRKNGKLVKGFLACTVDVTTTGFSVYYDTLHLLTRVFFACLIQIFARSDRERATWL